MRFHWEMNGSMNLLKQGKHNALRTHPLDSSKGLYLERNRYVACFNPESMQPKYTWYYQQIEVVELYESNFMILWNLPTFPFSWVSIKKDRSLSLVDWLRICTRWALLDISIVWYCHNPYIWLDKWVIGLITYNSILMGVLTPFNSIYNW